MLNIIEGLAIGFGLGLAARPLLDAYLMWRYVRRDGAERHPRPLPVRDDAST